jgi:hypothetical protein
MKNKKVVNINLNAICRNVWGEAGQVSGLETSTVLTGNEKNQITQDYIQREEVMRTEIHSWQKQSTEPVPCIVFGSQRLPL